MTHAPMPSGACQNRAGCRDPSPGFCCGLGTGQIRGSAPKRTHAGATDEGSCGPGANMAITVAVNATAVDRISRVHQVNGAPFAELTTVRPSRSYRYDRTTTYWWPCAGLAPAGPQPRVTAVAQAAASDQVHHQAEGLPHAEQVTHPDHVAVPQHQQDRALLDEPGHQLGLPQQALVQQLHRDRLAGGTVHAMPYRAGRALPDRAHEEVRAADATPAQVPGGVAVAGRRAACNAARAILSHSTVLPGVGSAPESCCLSG